MNGMIDGLATTCDWQESPTRIAVLPVGSCEQHGGRLPLLTDTILAEHFARLLAGGLGAALLPAVVYNTSHEHTGFRGSFSLRPETAMAVLRDIVACLERQGFERLVLVNGHGGNFFVGPVIREINSEDRPLKILMVECGAGFDDSPEGARLRHGELHGGASEISRIMAIRPDVVRPPESATPDDGGLGERFQRADLNTFGIGCRHPGGVWGDARGGDAASGAAMIASIARNQLAFVRERLGWLDAQPAYAGAGGIAVRPMLEADVPAGMRLCGIAGWNQTAADWRLFLAEPATACVAVRQGRVVGSAVAIAFGRIGWIGMVLVDPALRRMGVGTRLMRSAMTALSSCTVIGLDATAAGRPVYERLGFTIVSTLHRLVATQPVAADRGARIRPMQAGDLPMLAEMDASGFGSMRYGLLHGLLDRSPGLAWTALTADGGIAGGIFGRPGAHFTHLGPLVACDAETARALLAAAIASCPQGAVGIDAVSRDGWLAWLASLGFAEERRFDRMVRGDGFPAGAGPHWAVAGPELG